MGDHREHSCFQCGSLLHHESDCPENEHPKPLLRKLEHLERMAVKRTSTQWALSEHGFGTAQIYAPNRGPLRVIVPIAETTIVEGEFIVELRNAAAELIELAKKGLNK